MSEDKNYSILNLDGASDVIIKMLVMIENAVGWIGAPKGAKKDFNEGLAIYKESIEKNDTLSGLEKGAKISNARMELKQYINQGKIISNAFKNLQNEAKMNVEDDWLLVFFEYAKNISDDEIQQVWGRILSEQFNGDSSVSRRLLHTLSLLDKNTALDFGKLSSITFGLFNDTFEQNVKYIPFICNSYKGDKRYDREYFKLLPDLINLEEYGLITVSPDKPYEEDLTNIGSNFVLIGNSKYEISKIKKTNPYDLGEKILLSNVRYTSIGKELYRSIDKPELFYGLDRCMLKYLKEQEINLKKII